MSSPQHTLPGTAALTRQAPGLSGRELDRMLAGLNGPQREATMSSGLPSCTTASRCGPLWSVCFRSCLRPVWPEVWRGSAAVPGREICGLLMTGQL